MFGDIFALNQIQIDWSQYLSTGHHYEVEEHISGEVLDVVTDEVIVESSVDPETNDSEKTSEVLFAARQDGDVAEE